MGETLGENIQIAPIWQQGFDRSWLLSRMTETQRSMSARDGDSADAAAVLPVAENLCCGWELKMLMPLQLNSHATFVGLQLVHCLDDGRIATRRWGGGKRNNVYRYR